MTMTNSKLFQRGPFSVQPVTIVDKDMVTSGVRIQFGVYHDPTGALVAVTSILPAAIKFAAFQDKELKKTVDNPDAEDEDAPRGFGRAFDLPGLG
jgi:hypothetical protein